MHLCSQLINLLNEFVTDYRTSIFLWKALSKLTLRTQLFVDIDQHTVAFNNDKDPASSVSHLALFNSFFLTLHDNLYLSLQAVRVTFTAPVTHQDTIKRIKFTSFLFKIFQKFVLLHQEVWLSNQQSQFLITNVFGLISSLLFFSDIRPEVSSHLISPCEPANKELNALREFFVKEFTTPFDALVTSFGGSFKFHLYLANFDIFSDINPATTTVQRHVANPAVEVFYEKPEHMEDTLVFVLLFLAKFYCGKATRKNLIFF
jgi:hypothetical protein